MIQFGESLDWAMLGGILVDDGMAADDLRINTECTEFRYEPLKPWSIGVHSFTVSPDLEDIAGNNLIEPFEVDVTSNSGAPERKPVRIEFEVRP